MSFKRMIERTYNARLGFSPTYSHWPLPDGAGAVAGGVKLTTGNAVWGALTDIIAAAAIALDYWVCGASMFTASAAQKYEFQLFQAAAAAVPTVPVATWVVNLTAATVNLSPHMFPIPIHRIGGGATCARAGGAGNAKTIYLGLIYATGL